jgi:hypothetical protein
MTIFDLVFILVVLSTAAALVGVTLTFLLGRSRLATRLLTALGAGLALYLCIVVVVSLLSPQRVLALKEKRCFDDWCIAVDDITPSASTSGAEYTVSLQLSSRALRTPQRENGMVVYLVDGHGYRFDPLADPAEVPFTVLLQPGESVTATRVFDVSGASGPLNLVVEHAGSRRFPGIFIIGDDSSLLHKPVVVRVR